MLSQIRRRKNVISAPVASGEYAIESVDFDAAESVFIRHCRVKNLTPHTITFYIDVLRELRKLLAEQNVSRPIDITASVMESVILAKRSEGVADATIDKLFRGWRAFFNFLADNGFITVNPVDDIRLKSEKRVIETFTKPQIKALLSAPNRNTFTGYRDYVLMSLLLDTGVRISEAAEIKLSDIRWKERQILVYGKGRKERYVPFQHTLERHLNEYIMIRGKLDHDYLFVNINNGPFRVRGMQQTIRDHGLTANIRDVRVSPHTFRHTFAKYYVMNGGDPFSLQKILGHTSLEIVRMYVNLFSTDVSRQHAKFSPLERLHEDY